MPDSEPPLEADEVAVVRGESRILDDVSLTLSPGTRTLIQGPSGSGKTTLFQVLGLLAPPDEGRLYVDGTDVSGFSDRKRAALRRTHVGLVFQDFQLIPDLTAWENARLPQEHAGETDADWLAELFEDLAIADLRDQYPGTLSGGECQRVAIARALANRPTVVLADEPTGQLDPETAERVLDLFLRVQDDAESALAMISHDADLSTRFETTHRLVDGRLVDTAVRKPA
jgi:putative ABC transport system ATP-binding protein